MNMKYDFMCCERSSSNWCFKSKIIKSMALNEGKIIKGMQDLVTYSSGD